MKAHIGRQQLRFPPTAPAEKLHTERHHFLPNSQRSEVSSWRPAQSSWCRPDAVYPEVNPPGLNNVSEFECNCWDLNPESVPRQTNES